MGNYKLKIELTDEVREVIDLLNKNGYEAFAVGGCIRDSLLGKTPNDWDICTSAKPDEIKKCFKNYRTIDTGIKHGTISVLFDENIYEITTYRIDGEYFDNRRPENVIFTDSIEKDLARRDFTINAIAYNEKDGIVDPFSGINDLKQGLLRCVRNPDERFCEDALRIIRALRFASVYNLSIDNSTSHSVIKNADLLLNISSERISAELNRLLCGERAEQILNDYRDVFAVIIPEIRPMFDYEQHTKHHNRDLWRHTTYSVKSIEPMPLLRMTMLLHDLGKPRACKRDADGTGHFKGHPKFSAESAEIILRRLKYPSDFIDDCITLIKYHDVRFSGSKRQLKHVMSAIGEDRVRLLLKVQAADIAAQSDYKKEEKLLRLALAEKSFDEIIAEKSCFTLKQLDINGYDLINMGITDGITIGKTLKLLLSLVIDEKIENKKAVLTDKAAEINNLRAVQ